jgi:hypothetical protein
MVQASSASPVRVVKVTDKKTYDDFFNYPWKIYKGDPHWVPPLLSQRRDILDKKKNPTWEYMEGDYFVAYRGDEPVGTIAAFVNHHHNEFWKENIGFFGFFETIDDQAVATALLKAAADHIRSLGSYDGMRGPANFTVDAECGLLIDGFTRPVFLYPYNYPYYQGLVENSGLGLAKVMDVWAWYSNPDRIQEGGHLPEKLVRVGEKTKERYGISLRKPDPKNLRKEVALVQHLYNVAWERNWGFYPPTQKEADKLFKDLELFIDVDLVRFASIKGVADEVGFLLALPDFNEALHWAYPQPGVPEIITLLKVLYFWKIKRGIKGQRVMLMGVKPEYRMKGVEAVMNLSFFQEVIEKKKFYDTDSGWVLETNQPMNQLAITYKADKYKTWRFYQMPLK